MRRIEIKPGDLYGELEVVREVESAGKRRVLCKCACGQQLTVRLGHLRSGHSTTCGKCGIEHLGKRQSLREWAREYNINESTLRARLRVMGIRESLERK